MNTTLNAENYTQMAEAWFNWNGLLTAFGNSWAEYLDARTNKNYSFREWKPAPVDGGDPAVYITLLYGDSAEDESSDNFIVALATVLNRDGWTAHFTATRDAEEQELMERAAQAREWFKERTGYYPEDFRYRF